MASAVVDLALQDVDELLAIGNRPPSELKNLRMGLRNLRTFLLCARKWPSDVRSRSDDNASSSSSLMGSLLGRLEDALVENGKGLHSLCLVEKIKFGRPDIGGDLVHQLNEYSDVGGDLVHRLNKYSEIGGYLIYQFKECIKSFSQEINESYVTLSDYCSLHSGDGSTEFIDSLLLNMADMRDDEFLKDFINALKEKLVFFQNFVRFAELRGFEPWHLQVLSTHFHVVAVNAARLCYEFTFLEYADKIKLFDEFQMKFSDLLLKIKPVDPQIIDIYVHVLKDSNFFRSSHTLTLETDKHVLGDFVDSLLHSILEALKCGDSYMVSLNDQVSVLYDGIRFLRTILTKHLEKIDKLHVKAKELVGSAVNEAAIVICSLPVHELKEGLTKEMNVALSNFLEKIKLIKVITSALIFPKTNKYDFIDFILENLKKLPSCNVDSITLAKDQIQTVQEDLVSLRAFLESILGQRSQDEKLQSLWSRVAEVAYKIRFVIESLMVGDIPDCSTLEFNPITEEIALIKLEALKIANNQYISEAQKADMTSNPSLSLCSTAAINKAFVTLDDEANKIIEHLITGSKQLDIMSIVGMPGLGKTTLARSVYDDPSVKNIFHIRAWCVVSQVYKKKDLLLRILDSVAPNFSSDKYLKENEQDLEEKLKKCLLRRRYLIVLDDIWDTEAWSGLERSFPDDGNSSRILLTSRDSEVVKRINPNREPHPLRQLTDDECWDLLQKKLSCLKSYPLDLGMKIAKNCRGLPLTVVIVAGILANSEQDDWEGIAGRLSLSALSDTNQCMDILELSFRKLPENLKSCLLYFGSFPEDEEVPFQKMIWFWIAEGFIEKSETKSLEDVAKDYVNDLIKRSLVMVSEERSVGGVKTCYIHDLLHEFCVIKARKEKFMFLLRGHDELYTFLGQCDLQRLCVHSTTVDFEKSMLSCPGVRSLLFFGEENDDYEPYHISSLFHFFKLLKVLDLTNFNLGSTFPSEIALLIELRYLAIQGMFESIPSAVANLSYLETLLVYADKVLLPDTIWNMPKLRVLWSYGIFYASGLINLDTSELHSLETLSTLKLSFGHCLEKLMRKLPNIRKLKCKLFKSGESNADCNRIVVMDFLSQLESLHLKLSRMDKYHIRVRFPLYLKKLSLLGFHESIIPKGGELPNLLALKLLRIDFDGDTWDMNEGWEFPKLKFLELNTFRIVRWTGSDGVDHFPCLEKLKLWNCYGLKEIPSCLGDATTLEVIKVIGCDKSVGRLFLKIKEEQKENWGNENLQVLISDY